MSSLTVSPGPTVTSEPCRRSAAAACSGSKANSAATMIDPPNATTARRCIACVRAIPCPPVAAATWLHSRTVATVLVESELRRGGEDSRMAMLSHRRRGEFFAAGLLLRLARTQRDIGHEQRDDQRPRREDDRNQEHVVQGEGERLADGVHRLIEEGRQLCRKLGLGRRDPRRIQ